MWGETKLKQFRDPVHGYISIPDIYCRLFIDSEIFQRLRCIEQTSMRPLYPGARHDRFIHSLGVYHLASIAFHHICKNTSKDILVDVTLHDYKNTFLIAALMHDCGHAPFSHLFEGYYNADNQAYNNLLKVAGEEFQKDYAREKEDFQQAAPHEEFSAYILIKYFKDVQNELDDFDPVLAARMITGCVHMDVSSKKNAAENCLIQLINGSSIDVDKLDYIARDTWASGVNNNSIDTHRLLSALEIVERESGLSVVFQKSALSVVQSVVDGRNFLYRWIYSHHMVLYYNHLWENALKKLEKIVPKNEENNKTILDTMFSEQSFANPSMHENYSIYLPSDGDIYFLLKCHLNDIPEVRELLSRKLSKIPLWKTYAEFSLFFKDRNDRQIAKICARSSNCLSSLLDCSSDDIFLKKIKPKYAEISKNDINIKLSDNEFISYEAAVDQKTSSHETFEYFYVFIPKSKESRKGECIERLRTLPV